jgi:hypothetical protein
LSYGAQVKFGIARQASAGTAVTDATSFHGFAFTSESVGYEAEELISQNLTGRFSQGAAYSGPRNVAGTIEFEVTPRNLGAALAACVNHSPASVTSSSIRSLTFLPTTTDFSSTLVKAPFTVYKQFTDANSAEHFYDCQFGQIAFQFGAGAFLRGTLTCVGGTPTSTGIGSADILPAASDVGRLFPWNVSSVSYGGSGVSNFSEITVTINESIEPLNALNASLAPFKFTRSGFREVTVNGTFYMTDRTMLNNFVNETQARLLLTAINTQAAIQSGYYNTFTIDVPQLKVTEFKPTATGPGEVAVTFSGRGVIDPTSAYDVQFTFVTTWQAGF